MEDDDKKKQEEKKQVGLPNTMKLEIIGRKYDEQQTMDATGVDRKEYELPIVKGSLDAKLIVPTIELWALHTPKSIVIEVWAKNDNGVMELIAKREGTANADGTPSKKK